MVAIELAEVVERVGHMEIEVRPRQVGLQPGQLMSCYTVLG